MTDTIPDHVGREACRLLSECGHSYKFPRDASHHAVITVAKLLMNPPAPMTDPAEEAAKRVLKAGVGHSDSMYIHLASATEQMRKEREAWEAER